MYSNQIPVFAADASFTADYSLVVSEASKLSVTLSNAFTNMVFGFLPDEFIHGVNDQSVNVNGVNNAGIVVAADGIYYLYNYATGSLNNMGQIGTGDAHSWQSINNSNIAVSADGYFSIYSGSTWTEPALIGRDIEVFAINDNNIAVGLGYWVSYDGTTWTTNGLINGSDDNWVLLNNNNLAVSNDGYWALYDGHAWATDSVPWSTYATPISLNNNNIVLTDNQEIYQYSFDTGLWTQIPFPSNIDNYNIVIITDQNLFFGQGQWTQWDGISWSPVRQLPDNASSTYPVISNSKGLIVGGGGWVEYLNIPMPTNNATITQNITDAKVQLVTAYAAKYGANVPYE